MTKKIPEFLLLLFQFLCLMLLAFAILEKGSNSFMPLWLFLGIAILLFFARRILQKRNIGYIFILISFLSSLGILMIYRLDNEAGIKQGIFLILAVAVFFSVTFIFNRYPHPEFLFYPLMLFSILLFVVTLILGKRVWGAVNWIDLKFIKFQPAEIIKLITVFLLAVFYGHPEAVLFHRLGDGQGGIKIFERERALFIPIPKKFPVEFLNKAFEKNGGFFISVFVYIEIGFLFLQKDLGMAVLFFITLFAVQFVYEKERKLLWIHILLAVLGSAAAFFLFNHVRVRIDAWLRPLAFADGKGYQITQSQIAIACGGFFGSGVGLGYPKYIPAVKTDFIFSAICEEMGIFMGIAVILVFMLLVYRGLKIALKKPGTFRGILALGLSVLLGAQAFIITAGVTRMIPMTGITLPFVSYGGSSLLTSFMLVALLEVADNAD